MLHARCLLDGQIYDAQKFSELPFHFREEKRLNLVCPNADCNGPAFFRRQSRSGQAACFGARPHVPGCYMAAQDSTRLAGGDGDEEDQIFNPGNRIELDLGYGANPPVHIDVDGSGGIDPRAPRRPRYVGDGARPDAVMHKRLRPLLRSLILNPAFAESEVEIFVPERGTITARNLFVEFGDASRVPADHYYALWGTVASAGYHQGTLWLNAGGHAEVSFPMSEELVQTLVRRLNVSEDDLIDELPGCCLLVLGFLRVAASGKIYCPPDSEQHIAIIPMA